jgi:hypothetical protein
MPAEPASAGTAGARTQNPSEVIMAGEADRTSLG